MRFFLIFYLFLIFFDIYKLIDFIKIVIIYIIFRFIHYKIYNNDIKFIFIYLTQKKEIIYRYVINIFLI